MIEDPLFDIAPAPRLQQGDTVRIQTIWGTEICVVVDVMADRDGWPLVTLRTDAGDTVSINISRVLSEVPC